MSNLQVKLSSCFSAVFPELPPARIPDASVDTVRQWDSLRHVTLVEIIEQDFGLRVEDEELEHLTSYAAWVQRLEAAAKEET